MNHVYEGDYAVLVPITIPPGFGKGVRIPIAVEAQWLACTDEICVPERGRLQTMVEVGPAYTTDKRLDQWLARLAPPLDARAHFVSKDGTIRLAIPMPAAMPLENPHFFAAQDRVIDYAAPQVFRRNGDMVTVELKQPKRAAASPEEIGGVLRLNGTGDGLSIAAEPGDVPTGGAIVERTPATALPALPLLLLGALAGGLLLNVMPCVFPILSLKALSLARAGESEAQARAEGLAYTAGVIIATVALGALLLALRAAGEEVGWAFQLQEPGVVAVLLLVATAITANFLGLFEFSVPGFAQAGSPQGAFATGLLAAFAATPCTGPFMAAAMGAALLLPIVPALALFATLGLGIALPFLAVALIPALRTRLPRPGAWMNRFRRWMALPMGLTALALVWLASRLGGMNFAFAAAALAIALVVVLWLAGSRQREGQAATTVMLAGLAVIAIAGFTVLPRMVSTEREAVQSLLDPEPFSTEALARARADGKPVFAWFTADWCITCKVNEKVAIEREDVRDAFAAKNAVVLRGDWTQRDPEITRYLTSQGAAGVPLYVWYPAGGGAPQKLPQVLTPATLTELAK
jgi:thiol:disulfide interchange protein